MAEFQLLRCTVALGGDDSTTVVRHRGNPIIFPELIVLQTMHGEEAVTDVHVVGTCEMSQAEAMTRLHVIYGKETIDAIFPGARPRLPNSDPSVPLCNLPIYVPKPVRPDNPDPKLRPLDQFTMPAHMPRIESEGPPPEDEPSAEEIAAHQQEDDEPAAEEDEMGFTMPDETSRPTVQDLPQSRVSWRGQATPRGRRTPDHLPDVAATPRIHRQRDTTRAKG